MIFNCRTAKDTQSLGARLGKVLKPGMVVSLTGPLGAGKTVLVKGVAKALGIKENIVSPTFTLVQEYSGSMSMLHLDLYRISGCEEFEQMGGEDFLYPHGVAFIEWSEKIAEMMPADTIYITLTIKDDHSRDVEIKGIEL